ncbi:MAG: PLP-dependent aminotransferase family protein [Acidimicrobiales bacterium]|nr:PLP-dependent aminotransferase family protein [Acidimicrobiales bacterium]
MTPDQLARRLVGWADGAGSLPERLALALRELVRAGLLPPGTRLPPERTLAAVLSVSRPTVGAALGRLRAEGIVEARQGSGTWVAHADQRAGRTSLVDQALLSRGINLAASVTADAGQLGELGLDLDDLLGVDPPHGYVPAGLRRLRELVAERYRRAELPTGADQVQITNGAHDGLYSVLGACLATGETILTEEYTYPGLLDLCEALGVRAVGVPVDHEGVEPGALERLLRVHRPGACVLAPACNNPTGRQTSARRVRELAAVLDTNARLVGEGEGLVIEDNALADLVWTGRPQTLAHHCRNAPVVSVESLAKSAWGGLRVGWVRLPPMIATAYDTHRHRVDLGVSVPSQLLAVALLPELDELGLRRRALLQQRCEVLRGALTAEIGTWLLPEVHGGPSLWVDTTLTDAAPLVRAAARDGLQVLSGAAARPAGGPSGWLRLCIDRPEVQLTEAAARLGRLWSLLATAR